MPNIFHASLCANRSQGRRSISESLNISLSGIKRLSIANARFKHMRDREAQKALISSGTGSVHGNADWVLAYDPVAEWDKEPTVPPIYSGDVRHERDSAAV